jgi:hypothetical protein
VYAKLGKGENLTTADVEATPAVTLYGRLSERVATHPLSHVRIARDDDTLATTSETGAYQVEKLSPEPFGQDSTIRLRVLCDAKQLSVLEGAPLEVKSEKAGETRELGTVVIDLSNVGPYTKRDFTWSKRAFRPSEPPKDSDLLSWMSEKSSHANFAAEKGKYSRAQSEYDEALRLVEELTTEPAIAQQKAFERIVINQYKIRTYLRSNSTTQAQELLEKWALAGDLSFAGNLPSMLQSTTYENPERVAELLLAYLKKYRGGQQNALLSGSKYAFQTFFRQARDEQTSSVLQQYSNFLEYAIVHYDNPYTVRELRAELEEMKRGEIPAFLQGHPVTQRSSITSSGNQNGGAAKRQPVVTPGRPMISTIATMQIPNLRLDLKQNRDLLSAHLQGMGGLARHSHPEMQSGVDFKNNRLTYRQTHDDGSLILTLEQVDENVTSATLEYSSRNEPVDNAWTSKMLEEKGRTMYGVLQSPNLTGQQGNKGAGT